jgi:hypothetical protein
MKTLIRRDRFLGAAWGLAAACVAVGIACQGTKDKPAAEMSAGGSSHSSTKDEAGSKAAFLAAYPVFMHPRCMNCHPKGDAPLQGDDSRPHIQNVKRGPDGKGLYALKCANCHQDKNVAGENMPPGNPNWHLPPETMKMVFEGRPPAQLARQFKDPKLNGGKTLEQLVHHVTEDSLVLGAWNPGDGRKPPPMGHADFARHFSEWVAKGAAIPD